MSDFRGDDAVNGPATPLSLPLVLDLDGTVLRTDLFLEGLVLAVRRKPWLILLLPFWLLLGRAAMKRKVAEAAELRVDLLPLNDVVVAYAAECDAAGQPVFIASAADEDLARRVARRLGFVQDVLASDGRVNLKAASKAKALEDRFPLGFAYAGDARADLPVWRAAAQGVYAGPSGRLERAAAQAVDVVKNLPQPRPGLAVWGAALRLHQWAKNALVFVPLVLAGYAAEGQAWVSVALAFLGMGLLSSSTYLINDLLDLEDDRNHWSKRNRPLASGALPIRYALVAAPIGAAAGLALGWLGGGLGGLACLLGYGLVTAGYSLGLKRYAVLDVLIIAGLFTVRLLLGAVVVGAPLRPWLFVFSMFLFTALSLAKRAAEIGRLSAAGGSRVDGRGYVVADAPVVTAFGVAAGVAAILVLVLYVKDEVFAQTFYRLPQLLWLAPVLLTLWLGRIWLICGRGELDDDPVAFAVKDRISLALGLALALAFGAAILP